jgi:hypothetical protein
VVKAKKTLQSGDQGQAPTSAEPKAVVPHDIKGL